MRRYRPGRAERWALALGVLGGLVVICLGLWLGLYLAARVVLELL